jgi:hypothetical protein
MNTASWVCSSWRSRSVLANALCDQCSLTSSPSLGGKSRSNSPPHGRGDGAWP